MEVMKRISVVMLFLDVFIGYRIAETYQNLHVLTHAKPIKTV